VNNPASRAFEPARLGALGLRNRIIKAATFEGKSPNGIPGGAFRDFHLEVARGGVAMTTFAYCASEADGRVNGNMMYMHEGLREPLSSIIDEIHTTGTKVSGQLVHCGGFSRNRDLVRLDRPLGPSAKLNLAGLTEGIPLTGAMSESDIDDMIGTFHRAALFMKDVGFDAIELHFAHGYALSQFISPKTNRRKDRYGGTLENRMRVPLRALASVRSAVGEDFPILGKMGLTDGSKGGLEEEEAIEVAALLDKDGIDGLITSGGTSSGNVMKMFHGPPFLDSLIKMEKSAITRLGMRIVGPRMFKDYPYSELYFLEAAKRVRDRVTCPIIYVGGCSSLESLATLMDEGFDFVQLGRALINDPNFVNAAAQDPAYVNGCTHCNECVALIDHPTGIGCPEREL